MTQFNNASKERETEEEWVEAGITRTQLYLNGR